MCGARSILWSFFFVYFFSDALCVCVCVCVSRSGDRSRPAAPATNEMAISPLVAIVTGAVSALFLLVALLVIALRLRCRRMRRDPTGLAASTKSRGSTVTDLASGAPSAASPETMRSAAKATCPEPRTTRTSSALFNVAKDDSNPDLIPQLSGKRAASVHVMRPVPSQKKKQTNKNDGLIFILFCIFFIPPHRIDAHQNDGVFPVYHSI